MYIALKVTNMYTMFDGLARGRDLFFWSYIHYTSLHLKIPVLEYRKIEDIIVISFSDYSHMESKVQKILANPTEPWWAIIHHETRCQKKKKRPKRSRSSLLGAERPKAKSTMLPTGEHPKPQCKRSDPSKEQIRQKSTLDDTAQGHLARTPNALGW